MLISALWGFCEAHRTFKSTNPVVIETCNEICDNSDPDICGCTPDSCLYYSSLCEMQKIYLLIKTGFEYDNGLQQADLTECVSSATFSSYVIDQLCDLV